MHGNHHRQVECESCNAIFEFEAFRVGGSRWEFTPNACEKCEELQKDGSLSILQAKADRIAAFRRNIPKIFRDTDRARLPSCLSAGVDQWKYGPQGLAFAGPSGRGKTRAMFLLLERMVGEGRSADFITATDFDHVSRDQFSDDAMERNQAKEKLRSIRSAKMLLLDDLGKGKMTERTETELFSLFDHRTSEGLPTLWTSNLSADGLKAMVTADRAAPLLRRLTEFTTIITP